MALSDIILSMKIALRVPVSSINPHCSLPISGFSLLRARIMMILKISFVIWLIRLIVLCISHSIVPDFFGSAMNIDLLRSVGMSPLSYILFIISVTFWTPKSSRAAIISITILSGPAAFFFFIFDIAHLTSDSKILGPSIFFCMIGFPLLSSSKSSLVYSTHHSSIFSLSIMMSSFLAFMHPDDVQAPLAVNSLILLCTELECLDCSISLHLLFNHSSFATLHSFYISIYVLVFLTSSVCNLSSFFHHVKNFL